MELFSELISCSEKELVYSKILKVFVDIFPSAEKGTFALIDEKDMHKMYFAALHGYSDNLLKVKLRTEDSYLYIKNHYSCPEIINNPLEFVGKSLNSKMSECLIKEKGDINQTLVTPIYGYGKVFGVIGVDSFGKNKFKNGDVRLIKYFINRISYLLEYFVTRSKMDYDIDIDSLTQIYSRKYFLEILDKTISGRSMKEKFALIIFDIDDFKKINDTYGHIIGDEVLADFGRKLLTNCKENGCICGRLGGDEFGLISKNKEAKYIMSKIQNLRRELKTNPYKGKYRIDISYGFVLVEGDMKTDSETLINQADLLMYQLKKTSKKAC
jgi:diguanylate cyclase (GGDEF)-like protein